MEICPICSHKVEGAEGVDVKKEIMYFCNDCQRHVCPDCYWPISRRCDECMEEHILNMENDKEYLTLEEAAKYNDML